MTSYRTTFDENLLLTNETARRLYHDHAADLPIIDYHCHLSPKAIAEDVEFEDIGQMWLEGDHYKWRAMRTFGIDEELITGASTTWHEKYLAFVSILPKLIGNPLYIWSALELKRFFGIDEPLTTENAEEIYEESRRQIRQKHIGPRYCIAASNVEVLSTTEDPVDTLEYHRMLTADPTMSTRILTAFRPDKALYIEKDQFALYAKTLGEVSDTEITDFASLIEALGKRLAFFAASGTTINDNGVEELIWADSTPAELDAIIVKGLSADPITRRERDQYRSAFLLEMGKRYHDHGFVMQLHIGTYQDANTLGVRQVGVSTGFDCIDDSTQVRAVGTLLDRLTLAGKLPKTILYPLDQTNIESWAVLAAGFCQSGTRAKVQLGAPWWFGDQPHGIARQFASVANLYPIALSVGMLTDSRSFLSYPRHELYRRVLCDFLGSLVERGEYFAPEHYLHEVVRDVCYANAKEFFGL